MDHNFSEEDVKKVAKGAATTLLGSGFGKGLFFVLQIVLARLLGVEEFGLYTLGFAVVKIGEIISRMGLNMGGMRFVSIYKDDDLPKLKGTLISCLIIPFINATLIGGVLYFSSELLCTTVFHRPDFVWPLKLFAFSLPFVTGLDLVAQLLQGFHTTKYTVLSRDIVQPVLNILLVIIFYLLNYKLSGVIAAFAISSFLAFLYGCFCIKKLFPGFTTRNLKPSFELKNLLAYSLPLLFVGFLNYLLLWKDVLMLGYLSTTTDVGIYRAASQVPYLMTIFLVAVNSLYAPVAANLFRQGEMQRLGSILKTTTRWATFATIPVFFFLLLAAKDIMTIFGEGYVKSGYLVLIILAFGQLINCITGGVGFTLTMTGRQKLELLNSLALVSISIALNFWLIPRWGVFGAAIASSFSVSLINVIRVFQVYFIYHTSSFSKNTIYILAPVTLCCVVAIFYNYDFPLFISLIIKLLLVSTIFSLSFYKMKISSEDKYIYDIFRQKILSKVCQ